MSARNVTPIAVAMTAGAATLTFGRAWTIVSILMGEG